MFTVSTVLSFRLFFLQTVTDSIYTARGATKFDGLSSNRRRGRCELRIIMRHDVILVTS